MYLSWRFKCIWFFEWWGLRWIKMSELLDLYWFMDSFWGVGVKIFPLFSSLLLLLLLLLLLFNKYYYYYYLYSGTPPYDPPVYKTTSLLRPYSFKPKVQNIDSFYYFKDPVNATTSLLRPGFYGPMMVVLTGFHCNIIIYFRFFIFILFRKSMC